LSIEERSSTFFKKLLLVFLNIYPLYVLVSSLTSLDNIAIVLGIILSIIFFYWGILRLNIYYISISFITLAILNIGFKENYSIIYTLMICIIWLLTSDYMIDIGVEAFRETLVKTKYSSLIISIMTPLIIIIIYLFLSYQIYLAISAYYSSITNTMPGLFKIFYEKFVSTRLGSILFIIISITIISYVLKNYITDLLADIIFIKKSSAIRKIFSTLREEFMDTINDKDYFHKLYMRTSYIAISFLLYGLTYPIIYLLTTLLRNYILGILMYFLTWYLLSLTIYRIVKTKLYQTRQDIKKLISIKPSFISFFTSLAALAAYIAILIMYSNDAFTDILLTSIGIGEPKPFGRDLFTNNLSKAYISISDRFYFALIDYFNKVAESYIYLSDLIKKLFEFIWG